jgi:hypothetical protein
MSRKVTLVGKVDPTKLPKGHPQTPRSAVFNDRRTKRLRTRSAQKRAALEE